MLVFLVATARAQEEAKAPAPTVVVERGGERITVCLVPGGEPLVFVAGVAVPTVSADGEHTAHAGEYTVHVRAPAPTMPLPLYQNLFGSDITKALTKGRWVLPPLADRPHIGVQVGRLPQALADHLGLDPEQCVLILSATEGGPADQAGIKANDILMAIDGKEGVQDDGLSETVAKKAVGETIKLGVLRRGARKEIDVVVGQTAGGWRAGVQPFDPHAAYVLPETVRFTLPEEAKGRWLDHRGVLLFSGADVARGKGKGGAGGGAGNATGSEADGSGAGGSGAGGSSAGGSGADAASLREELQRIRELLDRLQKQIEKQGDGR